MATLELYEPRTGRALGPKVVLAAGELDFSADPDQRIRGVMDRALAHGEAPEAVFQQFADWSNSQGTAGLRLVGEPPDHPVAA